MEAKEKNHVN